MAQSLAYKRNGQGVDIQRMTDEELALLRYNLRVAYANELARIPGRGNLFVTPIGPNTQAVGTAQDTVQTPAQSLDHVSSFQNPSTGERVVNTYNYRTTDVPIPITPSNFGDQTYARWSGSQAAFVPEQSITRIVDDIIVPCRNDMINGDGVGTFFIRASRPGGGTFDDRGLWFRDTTATPARNEAQVRAQNRRTLTQTNYNLWFKRSNDIVPIGLTPLRVVDGGLQQMDIGVNSDLVQNILLPLLLARPITYTITNTAPAEGNKGNFTDTRLNTFRRSNVMNNTDDYDSYVAPDGSAVAHQQYYLRAQ